MRPVLFLLFAALPFFMSAQQPIQKIGHADWQYIFEKLPEYKTIEADLKAFESKLQSELKAKNQELEAKYKAYQSLPSNTPDAIRKDKESELTFLQENLRKFTEDAQVSIQKRQNDLIKPVFEKVGKAIEDVAVENGFAYIINPQNVSGGDILLFGDEKYNISNLVLKKLGVVISE
jgi:outer membrane protein